ncbi:NAD(P)H-quinone oxidoreductase [Gracilibacillus alcaliphilus]|uniref:NAD(P)H-quinone oxidoreductase n=1 Tax=Gracilibacillus alcaliphilus TaxID=1401441 RepID=UPI00195B3EE7|nr:NAD(P)H-quinone oxidoreductase [Gracilibacillus alcaliphilus]MBM7677615.1 putative PIG3 family NAD(P)H quinone oxidoreductase [Gracilibacillus alcaliphilus]
MKAVIAKQPGGAEQLVYQEMADPMLAPGDILIEVHATAVNRTDILNREGKSGYAKNPIIGVETAGIVIDTNGHRHLKKGDRVMGLVNGGAYAEKAAMPADRAMPIPSGLTFEQAAAIPEVFLTAFQTLYWIGRLQQNEKVLIHAAASGVGTAAIQLARTLSQAEIFVTAGSARKLEFCQELGADTLMNYREEDFTETVGAATNDQGVQLILDFIGSSYWTQNLRSIAVDGRWVLIGVLGGSTVEKISLMELMAKRIQLTGTLLTPRSDNYKARLTADFMDQTYPYFKNGELRPVIDSVFPMEDVAEAHRHMEANKNIGKIILQVK